MMSNPPLTHPLLIRLYNEVISPAYYGETDRIVGDMRRHMAQGRYDRDRAVHSFERYVVEPAAIALGGGDLPWFKVYTKVMRAEVAQRLVRGWEREIGP